MAEQNNITEKSLRDILNVLFKHKWKIIPIFLISMIVVAYIIKFAPNIYESNAKLLVGGGQISAIETATGISGSSKIYTEIELLRSRGFAEAVVDKIGSDILLYIPEDEKSPIEMLFDSLESIGLLKEEEEEEEEENKPVNPIQMREAAIRKFMGTLSVGVARSSNIINISYEARTPEVAQEILTETVYVYMDKSIEMHTSEVSLKFLSEELERIKASLSQSEEELRKFQDEIDIVSLPEQQSFLLQRIYNLKTEIEQAEAEIYVAQVTIEEKKKNIDFGFREEEIRLESLNAKVVILNKQLENAKSELNELSKSERRFIYLKRNSELLEANYKRYLTSLEKARIAKTLESEKISNISIMQEPTYLIKPISQERKKTIAIGLFIGLAGSIGLAVFLEYLNHKVRSIEDIEKRILLQNIISIPPVNTKTVLRVVRKEGKRKQLPYTIPLKIMSKNVTIWLHILKELRDCFENIKAHLSVSMNSSDKAPYILGVTSCYRGEGVSTVATGIAYAVSLFEKENVLLVDSNLHHPKADEVMGLNRPPGLFEMTVKRQTPQPYNEDDNIYSFSNGNIDEYASTTDGSTKINKLLPSVERLNYKLIVLDLPSISEGASAARSAGFADGVILVIEAEKVRREVVNRAKEEMEKAGVNIFSVVLNKRRYYIPSWLYRKF